MHSNKIIKLARVKRFLAANIEGFTITIFLIFHSLNGPVILAYRPNRRLLNFSLGLAVDMMTQTTAINKNYYPLQFNSKFPIGIDTQWLTPEQVSFPDACLKNWLLDTGSLTERLQSQCRQLDLVLLGQAPMAPTTEELTRLHHADGSISKTEWQIREVFLASAGTPWVFARSILPTELCNQDLAELGNNPLGKVLFNDNRFVRQPFEVAVLHPGNPLFGQLQLVTQTPLWARRSVFTYKQFNMMVAEVFLPKSPAFKMQMRDVEC